MAYAPNALKNFIQKLNWIRTEMTPSLWSWLKEIFREKL
jgi:hypothetical protein